MMQFLEFQQEVVRTLQLFSVGAQEQDIMIRVSTNRTERISGESRTREKEKLSRHTKTYTRNLE